MGRKSRETILKRVRELKRKEKAARKRERRLARKQGDLPDDDNEFGPRLDANGEPIPDSLLPPPAAEASEEPQPDAEPEPTPIERT